MSLKLSLDLISHTDWSIHKNQSVAHEVFHRKTLYYLLLYLYFLSSSVTGFTRIVINAWRTKSQTSCVLFNGKYCDRQNRRRLQVNQNV